MAKMTLTTVSTNSIVMLRARYQFNRDSSRDSDPPGAIVTNYAYDSNKYCASYFLWSPPQPAFNFSSPSLLFPIK